MPPTASSLHSGDGKHSCLHSNRREEMPLVESTCCMNCHRLLQMIVVLETKFWTSKTGGTHSRRHHGPPQHTDGESCESQHFI